MKKKLETGTINNKKSSGRPPKLSARDVRSLEKIVRTGRRKTLNTVTAEYNEMQRKEKQVCGKTINKYLKAKRWNKRVAAKVLLIYRENRKKTCGFLQKNERLQLE